MMHITHDEIQTHAHIVLCCGTCGKALVIIVGKELDVFQIGHHEHDLLCFECREKDATRLVVRDDELPF
jgi:hypothetical protein